MNVAHSIQASWNDGNSFTAPLSANFGTRYALVPVNDVYELQSIGSASSPIEIQVANHVGETMAITCLADGAPLIVQPSVAYGQMAVFTVESKKVNVPTVASDASVRVEYRNATNVDTRDAVLVFQRETKPSFDAIATAWVVIEHVPPGGGSVFNAPRIPLYFGLVRDVFESQFMHGATMSVNFTEIDLTNAGDTAIVKLTGDEVSGYTFAAGN